MKEAYLSKEEKDVLGRLLSKESVSASAIKPFLKSLMDKGFILKQVGSSVFLQSIDDRAFPYHILFFAGSKAISKAVSFLEIESTNEFLKKGRETFPAGTIVFTDNQTRGKGKWDRTWFMKEGKSLLFSLILELDLKEKEHLGFLTMAAALSVCLAAEETSGIKAGVKWPNDVLIGDKKFCGILTESNPMPGGRERVTLGVGINVNYEKDDLIVELQETATSLFIESGQKADRYAFFSSFIRHFEGLLEALKKGNFQVITDKWNERAAFKRRDAVNI